MMKAALLSLASLVALFLVLLLAVRLFVNPNDYKDRIARSVRESTGRELSLPGQIHLSVFPWVALELGPASLGNPPGFTAEPFAAVKHAVLRVRLLPLLHKELQIGRIEIDGLDLRLRKNVVGRGNWDFASSNANAKAPASGGETLGGVAGLVIKNSRISYQDLVAERVNLSIGSLGSGATTPAKFSLSVRTTPSAAPTELAGQTDVVVDNAQKQYRFQGLRLEGTLGSKTKAALPWKFTAAGVDLDLNAGTVRAPAFSAELGAAHLKGSLSGSRLTEAPMFRGTFALEPVNPKELMATLGVTAPKTRDARVLSRLAASGEFSYGANALGAEKLDLRLDDSTLRGSVAITNLDTDAANVDLTLDHIDLDRYRAPPEKAPAPVTPSTSTESSSQGLKKLQLNGRLEIGSAHISGLDLTQVHAVVAARDGVTHIAPATAKLYGGDYAGEVTLDDRGAVPALRLQQSMKGVDMLALLRDFARSQRLSGRGNVTMDLTAHGVDTAALMKSLNGHIAANLDSGAVEGIDLWFEINRAIALIQQQPLSSASSSGRTKFDTFKASADLTDGVAASKDLSIISQNLRVAGQGTVNLVSQALDFRLRATILKSPATGAGAAGGTLADIPLMIGGSLNDPKVRPDVEGLARARVQQELNKHKDELQQKLQDKLKDLLK